MCWLRTQESEIETMSETADKSELNIAKIAKFNGKKKNFF